MSAHIYKKIELVGASKTSIEDAIENALARAGQTVREMQWFEVEEIRGYIGDDHKPEYQVSLKIGFTISDTKDS